MAVIMYRLKENGRVGVILPDGFLFGEGVKTRLKQKLVDEFNLHTIIRLPHSVLHRIQESIRTFFSLIKQRKQKKLGFIV
ncbi:type I restriction-modification system M protein [Streptococcus pneumoniae]|nr:type I restriction-modification system M protein [Streptococcus pneumoniae]